MNSRTEIKVRYAETDQMGVVHHAVYPVWLEAARTDYIRELGITYKDMEAMGIMLPVHSLSLKYLSPARYDDDIIVETSLKRLTPARIEFEYKVYKKSDGTVCVKAESTNAWVGSDMRPMNVKRNYPELFEQIEALAAKQEEDNG